MNNQTVTTDVLIGLLDEAGRKHNQLVTLSGQNLRMVIPKLNPDQRVTVRGDIKTYVDADLTACRFNAQMKFLEAIRADMVQKNPIVFMDDWEKLSHLKEQQKADAERFDNSPCPKDEIADLEGVGDAEGIMDRALALAGGDAEKLADVLEEKDKATSKWRRK